MSRSRSIASSAVRSGHRPELGEPALDRRVQPLGAAGRGQVGPAIVVACSPIAVANTGLSRKVSARNASTRSEKSDMGRVYRRDASTVAQ